MAEPLNPKTNANPLATLPSVLAICDLRRRLRRRLTDRHLAEADYVALLSIDPPAVLRALRLASAPIYGSTVQRWTVQRLVKALGPAISRRLTATPEKGMSGTATIRGLWMQTIATACAARTLAKQHDSLTPDEAYLFGLVHSLPQWLDQLSRLHDGYRTTLSQAVEFVSSWNLPAELTAAAQVGNDGDCSTEIQQLLIDAELVAVKAGFGCDQSGETTRTATPTNDTTPQQVEDNRAAVDGMLRFVGLDFSQPDLGFGDSWQDSMPDAASRARTAVDELTLTLLACSGSDTYRLIITVLTAAAVRYGGYDRALYTTWHRPSGRLVLRTKADSSSRRVKLDGIEPTEYESEQFLSALENEQPLCLKPTATNDGGLISALSVDEALIVPLNYTFESPSFLILDRSLSNQPIDLATDANPALAMSLTGTLLVENLLLRKRSDRAQTFASTDGLTRLLNRTMGLRGLDQEIARATRSKRPLAVLLCDLDYFKQLNDSFGHLQGDYALRVTADVLRQTLRRSDSISRFGGEEFLVVLPDTTPADATVLAVRLHTAIEDRGQHVGLPLTISIGLASSRFADTWETLLHRADKALYASKDRGRNRFAADTTDELDPPQPVAASPNSIPEKE